jgi:hypothetical protein
MRIARYQERPGEEVEAIVVGARVISKLHGLIIPPL